MRGVAFPKDENSNWSPSAKHSALKTLIQATSSIIQTEQVIFSSVHVCLYTYMHTITICKKQKKTMNVKESGQIWRKGKAGRRKVIIKLESKKKKKKNCQLHTQSTLANHKARINGILEEKEIESNSEQGMSHFLSTRDRLELLKEISKVNRRCSSLTLLILIQEVLKPMSAGLASVPTQCQMFAAGNPGSRFTLCSSVPMSGYKAS